MPFSVRQNDNWYDKLQTNGVFKANTKPKTLVVAATAITSTSNQIFVNEGALGEAASNIGLMQVRTNITLSSNITLWGKQFKYT